jgi:predicted dehydrogenase
MTNNASKKIRVGIIGASPDRGWAAQAHIPALKSLADDFEITALSTSQRESADAAGKLFGVSAAFDKHQDLVTRDDVDLVAISVKVPHHLELATSALEAGKAVYCEWPLGNGLVEAQTLATLAKKKGVLAVVGLQVRAASSVAYVGELIRQGYVGEVLSTSLIGSGLGWAGGRRSSRSTPTSTTRRMARQCCRSRSATRWTRCATASASCVSSPRQ